jgi:hypothetical protein
MLTPGVDRWKEGDMACGAKAAFLIAGEPQYVADWGEPLKADNHLIGQVLQCDYIGQRIVPQSVREAEARWILASSINYCIDAKEGAWADRAAWVFDFSCLSREEVEILGGEQAVIQMLTEGPGALWRWVMETRE